MPEYLPNQQVNVESLLRAYLATDFARPLQPPVFEWMMANGLAIWMLDGLDEVLARDPQFFEYSTKGERWLANSTIHRRLCSTRLFDMGT